MAQLATACGGGLEVSTGDGVWQAWAAGVMRCPHCVTERWEDFVFCDCFQREKEEWARDGCLPHD